MTREKRSSLTAGLVIVAAGCAAYANSWQVPFVFDDIPSIVDNQTIRQLWPLTRPLSPPSDWGFTVSGRPVLNLSLALNYAVSGLAVWSYHALNLVIHLLAGLTLFGIVWRTLERPALDGRFRPGDPRWIAFVIALLWTLHPLQTESVTYTIQRAESLMGLCFFATLYAFIRAVESPHPMRWQAAACGACLLGAGTKEIAALAPLAVFLYDRTFVSGTFSEAWRRHRWTHLALAATWLPLAWFLGSTGGNRGNTVGFAIGVPWTEYWLTQFEAIGRYIGLTFWPHPLVFDYGKVTAGGWLVTLPWMLPIGALVVLTAVALWRWPVAGFLGAWFIGILAPTSLVPGLQQMIVEHRMYLPLAAVIAFLAGVAARRLDRRVFLAGGATLALATGVATALRNADYRDAFTLWTDTIAKRPNNARAHNNLGLFHYERGEIATAIACYERSLQLDPTRAQPHFNLGLACMRAGRLEAAVVAFRETVRILPHHHQASLNLGIVLTALQQPAEAVLAFEQALQFEPAPAETHFRFGVALAQLGRWREAAGHYEQSLQLRPDDAEALSNWGVALSALGAIEPAIERFQASLRLRPDVPDVHFNLGLAFAASGRLTDAIHHYRAAVHLSPDHATAQLNLGIALGQTGRLTEAISHLQQAAQLRPNVAAAHTNLGIALAQDGRFAEALVAHEAAQRLHPDDAQIHYHVGYALLDLRRWAEARRSFEEALRLQPDFGAARTMLRQLPAPTTP